MLPDGEPRFSRPDGRPIPVAPVPPLLAEDPIVVFEQRHREEGLEIDSETGFPSWDGGTWDLNWALYCLRSIGKPEKRSRGNVRPSPSAHPKEQQLSGCSAGPRHVTQSSPGGAEALPLSVPSRR